MRTRKENIVMPAFTTFCRLVKRGEPVSAKSVGLDGKSMRYFVLAMTSDIPSLGWTKCFTKKRKASRLGSYYTKVTDLTLVRPDQIIAAMHYFGKEEYAQKAAPNVASKDTIPEVPSNLANVLDSLIADLQKLRSLIS